MSLGEAGADYIAFAPDTGAPGTQLDLVAWWAEIFEPPCVALGVTKPDEAVALAEAGADFVGIPAEAGLAPDDLARRIKAIAAALETCARVGAGEAP
jgi:thiamine-phosphate pyrophosphorylase